MSPPSCPPHRTPALRKTLCCDDYECVCNCANSTVSCPLGYLASTTTNDCGCITTTCLPDKVGEELLAPAGMLAKPVLLMDDLLLSIRPFLTNASAAGLGGWAVNLPGQPKWK